MSTMGLPCFAFQLFWSIAVLHPMYAQDGNKESVEDLVSSQSAIDELQDIVDTICEHHYSKLERSVLTRTVSQAIAKLLSMDAVHSDDEGKATSTNEVAPTLLQTLHLTLPKSVSGNFVDEVCEEAFRDFPSIGERVSAKESAVARQLLANQYVGIGVQVSIDPESKYTVLNKVFEGGTAFQAGLQAGDTVKSVDGNSTHQRLMEGVVAWLRGPAGSEVELEIARKGISENKRYLIPRRVIPLATMELTAQSLDDSVAIIKFLRIASSSTQELRRKETNLPASVRTVLLDFREVQEDGLHVVHLLLDALLDDGVVGYSESLAGKRTIECEVGRLFENRDIAVVVSPRTASCTQWASRRLMERGALGMLNISGTSTVMPFPAAGNSAPEQCEWTKSVIPDLVSIKNDRGSLRLVTGYLLDRQGQPSMNLIMPSAINTTRDESHVDASAEQLLDCLRQIRFKATNE